MTMLESHNAILPILVLYKSMLRESASYRTFTAAAIHSKTDPSVIAVYDNSPSPRATDGDIAGLLAYKHDAHNGGLAAAYNWALDLALSRGFTWLLLLDQDSVLPIDFLDNLNQSASRYAARDDVAAVLPHVWSGTAPVSPSRVRFARLSAVPASASGIPPYQLTGINSCALVKVSFLQNIGGYSLDYPLDSLDHWAFNQMHLNGKKVVISEAQITHDLSVLQFRKKVTIERYRSILLGEARFVTSYKRRCEVVAYLGRLLLRVAKQCIVYRNFRAALITVAMLVRIVATGKAASATVQREGFPAVQ